MNDTSTSSESDEAEATPTFASMGLSKDVLRAIEDMGFVSPTPVQSTIFDPALAGTDLIVQAKSGMAR